MKLKYFVLSLFFIGWSLSVDAQIANPDVLIVVLDANGPQGGNPVNVPGKDFSFNVNMKNGKTQSIERINRDGSRTQFRSSPSSSSLARKNGCNECSDCFVSMKGDMIVCVCKSCSSPQTGRSRLIIIITDGTP